MKYLLKASAVALTLSLSPIMSATAHGNHSHNQASQPTTESLVKLMEVVKIDQMFEEMGSQNDMMIEDMIEYELASDEDLTDEQKTRISATATKYISEMNKGYFEGKMRDTIVNEFVKAAQKHYTQKEVDAQIEFYSSNIGQNIVSKQSAVMQDYMTAIMPTMMEYAQKQSEETMPQMMDDIYEIMSEEE